MSAWRYGVAVCALATGSCGGVPTPGPWQHGDGYRWRALPPAGKSSPGFTTIGGRTGVRFANAIGSSAERRPLGLIGSGVAIADVDGDDLPDVYLARVDGANVLFRNLGGWRFRDVTRRAGVELADHASTGVVLADVDGDGDVDLLVNAIGASSALLVNDGSGRFEDVSTERGLADSAGGTTSTLADVDGDGDLDLYVADAAAITRSLELGGGPLEDSKPGRFYSNDGGGSFERVGFATRRFLDRAGRPFPREPRGFARAARFFDANADGAPDLYVASGVGQPDRVWLNDGSGSFRLSGPEAIRRASRSGMGLDIADVDRDGQLDVFEVDQLTNSGARTARDSAEAVGVFRGPGRWPRNVLLLNRGDGSFAEVATMARVGVSGISSSALFLDVDLDGYEDILVGTGHPWDATDLDSLPPLVSDTGDQSRSKELRSAVSLAAPNILYRNQGDLTFEDVSARWRFGLDPDASRGMALGDLDRDGDLDVVVNRLDGLAHVLRNDAPAPRVAVRLVGLPPNTAGVGARVIVRGGATATQHKEMSIGGIYLSSSEPVLSFAAGETDTLEISVRWRSGERSVVTRAIPGRLYEISEPTSDPRPRVSVRDPGPGDRWFEDRSRDVPTPHVETPFDEFRRQPLLPWRMSELGPGVGWIDLDRDGDDELILGSGAGGRLTAYWNDRGAFRRIRSAEQLSLVDLAGVAILPEAGRTSMLVGQSNYEVTTRGEAVGVPGVLRYRVERGRRLRAGPVVGGHATSVGPIALADVDGDGRLDLFVGGRVSPGEYPLATGSRLLRARQSAWIADTINQALLDDVGLVSSALFSDYDVDGDPDLVLAIEWGPVSIYRNDDGVFTEVTALLGLDRWTGRWNGVTSGDFDGDGQLDLIATNWGRNTEHQADHVRPLWIYYGEFGDDEVVHPLLARVDPGSGAVRPLTALSRLVAVLPAVRERVPTPAAYRSASIDELVAGLGTQRGRLSARTFDTMVFLNRGDHFEGRPLPAVAQYAPAFGVTVADFDGDGAHDVFLAQNFSGTDALTPRFDAGRGLILRGDGTGGFTPVSPIAAGISMVEDQRGAAVADYDGDGRVDLVVARNGAPVGLFRNRIARPGIRVQGAERLIGAVLRVETDSGLGPAYEIHSGGGYWSQDGGLVIGAPEGSRAVVIRLPGGAERRVAIKPGDRVVELSP